MASKESLTSQLIVAEHFRQGLVRHLRIRVEVWLGKDGVQEHTTEESAVFLAHALASLTVR